jgi:hypothetical protein
MVATADAACETSSRRGCHSVAIDKQLHYIVSPTDLGRSDSLRTVGAMVAGSSTMSIRRTVIETVIAE